MKKLDGYLTNIQIARLIGYSNHTVIGFFRKVFPDFPKPAYVSNYRATYYDPEQIYGWLDHHGVNYKKENEEMQWRSFNQATVPQGKVFMLGIGQEVFFAKIHKDRIITKYAYHEVNSIAPESIARKGAYLEVFLNGWAKQGITPMWTHFFEPEGSE